MARRARQAILYDSCFAHVFSRALDRKWIFEEKGDFGRFKSLLLLVKQKRSFQIHHYCLMNTHFHLAVSIPDVASFSKGLQEVKSRYTVYFNKKYHREGPLWRERFRSLVIEDEAYLSACGLYIEGNPVQAGMAKETTDWPYSSARHYLLQETDPLIDPYEREDAPSQVGSDQEILFTQGRVIGSELFKLHLKEGIFDQALSPPEGGLSPSFRQGGLTVSKSYDEKGNLVYEWEYDKDGNGMRRDFFKNGQLKREYMLRMRQPIHRRDYDVQGNTIFEQDIKDGPVNIVLFE